MTLTHQVENTICLCLLGCDSDLVQRRAQVVEQRLDTGILTVNKRQCRFAPTFTGDSLAQDCPRYCASLSRSLVDEAERFAVPTRQGTKHGVVRGAQGLPPATFEEKSPHHTIRMCFRRTPLSRRCCSRGGGCSILWRDGDPPHRPKLLDPHRSVRGNFTQQLALEHALWQGRPERWAFARIAPGPRPGEVEPFAGKGDDRFTGTARPRAARRPRRRPRGRSCRGRAPPAGRGSGSSGCRRRGAGSPRGRGRRRGGRRRRRRS